MLKYITHRLLGCLLLGLLFSCEKKESSFSVVLREVTDNLGASVRLSAIVRSGTGDLQESGFVVSTKSEDINIYDKGVIKVGMENTIQGGEFSLSISDLDPKTNYYYRAYAKGANGLSYSSVGCFTTAKDSILSTPYATIFAIKNGEISPHIRSRRYWQLDVFSGYKMDDRVWWCNLLEVLYPPKEGYGILVDADEKTRFIISPKVKLTTALENLEFIYIAHPYGTLSDSTRLKLYVTPDYEMLGFPIIELSLGQSDGYAFEIPLLATSYPSGLYVVWELVSGCALLADVSIKSAMQVKGGSFLAPSINEPIIESKDFKIDIKKIPLKKQR